MKKTKAFLLFLILMTTCPAWAIGGFVEPYVGFGKLQVGKKNATYDDFDDKDVADGFQLGIKGGASYDKKYFVGLDYNTAGPYVFGRLLSKGEWTMRMLGVGLGMNYEVVRFWAGYYFDDQFDDTKNTTKYQCTAYKVGFGLLLGKSIYANFDLTLHNFKTSDTKGSSTDVSNTYKAQSANISVSMPVNYGN